MSDAGSNRVNVVHKKFIVLADARAGSSVITTSGQPANAGSAASRAAAPCSTVYDGAPATRHPPQKTRTSVTPAGSVGDENTRGRSRIGSPRPSHTPFDPSFTRGPV